MEFSSHNGNLLSRETLGRIEAENEIIF